MSLAARASARALIASSAASAPGRVSPGFRPGVIAAGAASGAPLGNANSEGSARSTASRRGAGAEGVVP